MAFLRPQYKIGSESDSFTSKVLPTFEKYQFRSNGKKESEFSQKGLAEIFSFYCFVIGPIGYWTGMIVISQVHLMNT